MTGQDAVTTAEAFHKTLQLDGVILTKVDGDARGGAALSVKEVVGKPIAFDDVRVAYSDQRHQPHHDASAGRGNEHDGAGHGVGDDEMAMTSAPRASTAGPKCHAQKRAQAAWVRPHPVGWGKCPAGYALRSRPRPSPCGVCSAAAGRGAMADDLS